MVVSEVGQTTLITKGAPEEIAKVVTRYELNKEINVLTAEMKGKIDKEYRELSSQGFRVLGVCYKND